MDKRLQLGTPDALTGFRLPPGVSVSKQALSHGWAYVFRHQALGDLGRIALQETSERSAYLSCEVSGDVERPDDGGADGDLQTAGALEISRRMEGAAGGPPPTDAGWIDHPPRAPEPKELIESKLS